MTSRIFPKSVRFLCSAPITSAIFNSDRAKNSNFHDLSVQPKITYPAEQFSNICHNLAKILETKINKHDTVAMIADNSVFSAIVANSIWLAGGCVMPLSGKYPNPDLEHFLEDSGAKLFLVSEEFCQKETRVLNLEVCLKMRIGRYLFSDALPEKENLDPLDLSDPALLSQIQMLEQAWKVNSQDSILHCLPLHHVHGLINALLLPLATGADIHMLPGFKSADQIWQSLLENDVNLFMAVPTIYSRLVDLENVSSFNRQKIQNLKFSDKFRLLISGSAALPDPIFKKFENLSGGYQLLERYGMTEFCMGISNQIEGPKFPGFVGRELPGVEVRITDENGHILHQTGKNLESALAENLPISGNLLIKTPGMFSKYLNKPQATLETFTADGWFITGDQIQLDPNGLFKILGRSSTDIIKSGGYKISALEIEAKILQANSDLISECAVFGMADDDLGEKIVCLYVVKQGRHVEQKLNFDNLVKYQRPKILQRQDQPLLRNVMGKLNKKVIKQQFLEVQN